MTSSDLPDAAITSSPNDDYGSASRLPLFLYALTIFLSAFLLFQVQPIIARIILPWFGGTAAVWTTCLLFFQLVLLLGYLYAHGSIRYLPSLWQKWVHVGLLAISIVTLHMLPSATLKPQGGAEPTGPILLLLLLTIGLPYFLLSTTSPLLQAWYDAHVRANANADEKAKSFPYRLYALSNTGSLLALLSYPVLVEPRFTLHQQATLWQTGYIAFALLCIVVAVRMRGGGEEKEKRRRGEEEKIGDTRYEIREGENSSLTPHPSSFVIWILLAACSSTLLLAVSNHLSQNVAAIPFLWVLPLGLYLLSFIWCFGAKEWEWKRAFLPLPFAFCAAMAYALNDNNQNLSINILIPVFAGGLFVGCVVCHGELARLKPDTRHLTAFYLMLSIGGALGGVFVGVIAPRFFRAEYELPLAIGACAVISLFALYREPGRKWWRETNWIVLTVLTGMLIAYMQGNMLELLKDYHLTTRNFYGVLRVSQSDDVTDDDALRTLVYGTIRHGNQYLKPERRRLHTSYYGANTGVGLAIRARSDSHPERVGVIGLGTGSLASYGRKGDVYRYYEINPLVLNVARAQFTYLQDCPAQIDVVMGDARLTLESELAAGQSQRFDVLAVDAFSSDAIPVHLLTKEAFELYFKHLKPDGILCVHVSNRYLNLVPVVAGLADAMGREAKVINTGEDEANALSATEWVLITGQHSFFKSPLLKNVAEDIPRDAHLRTWTDDYSNLFQVLKRD